MVSAVEGLPEDVMPVQQIEQAVYARVIAHKPGSKSRQNPPRCFARPKEFPLDPYTISEHRGGGLAGGIYLDLARGQMRRAQAVASGPLGCRPHEFCPSCEPRSKRTANSRSTLATAHPRRARRRDTRAAAARLLLPVHKPRPSSCGRHRVDIYAIDATPARRRGGVDLSPRLRQPGRVVAEHTTHSSIARRLRRSPSPSKSSTP